MSEEKKIYGAICGVMQDIGAVGKNDTNRHQGFKYRGIDAVMNALNPAMIKNKIFCIPEVLEQTRSERTTVKGVTLIYSVCKMRYKFYATDGSFVEAIVVGEGMDSGDKATNKAMSIAFKYACFQTFCIPTEDMMDDPDATTPPNSTQKQTNNPPKENTEGQAENAPNIDSEKSKLLSDLKGELVRTGYGWASVIKKYKVNEAMELSKLQIKDCIAKMKSLPDKAENK